MGIFGKILKGNTAVQDNRTLLQKIMDCVKSNTVSPIIPLLSSKGNRNNPISIPYTQEAITNDFTAIQLCRKENTLTDNELAALIATRLLKKHPSSIKNLLSESGFSMPDMDRIIYLNTYTGSILSLREFISIGAKSYSVIGCGDQRMCSKCAKQDGKKHLVSKAVIGKTAPPFCEKCRCVMTAEF